MSEHVATIFHISDLHLLVEESGQDRPPEVHSARLLVAAARLSGGWLRDILAGATWHDREALAALRADLMSCLEEEVEEVPDDSPIIVVQTGDVEALGSAAENFVDGYEAFPGFAFVHEAMRDAVPSSAWLDLFGNHDTWPGCFPPLNWRHRSINRDRIASIDGLEGPWPDVTEFVGPSGVPVVLARVNTVSREMLLETFATGTVSWHPFAERAQGSVLDALAAKFEPWLATRAVRIVLLHHPPHVFDASWTSSLTDARLRGAEDLAKVLSSCGVQLVIAGHRHALDPALEHRFEEDLHPEPLEAPTVQLVAESPTQMAVAPPDDSLMYAHLPERSFCRYRLIAEDDSTLSVERAVFRYTGLGGGEFSREYSGLVFTRLPLE